ncbi:MAG: sulfatase-like hydrolase/transferase [bacterium]|nr:sulfatase-like hydrolase/transferase [bacterium]
MIRLSYSAIILLCLTLNVRAQAPGEIVGLYPARTANGVVEYRSGALTVADSPPRLDTGRVQLKHWRLEWSAENAAGDAIPFNELKDASRFYLTCRASYSGPLHLTVDQLEACKPVVLLVPASGVQYQAEPPHPGWFRSKPHRGGDDPNVVFLMIDALRADCTPPYGHPFSIAPHMEMLASLGVTFENSYGASSSTRPSVGTIFTGLHPVAHGAERHAIDGARLRPNAPRMAQWFHEMGYETAAVSSNAQISARYGFSDGFDRYHCPVREHEVTPRGLIELQRLSEPFFLYLHYIAPHQPYRPAEPYASLFTGMTKYPELDAYLAEIAIDDHRIGQVLAELARQGLLNRTLLWTMSDHGEEFWEHGWNGHGATLYEESVRTVSIVTEPSRLIMGRRAEPPVCHADIFATLRGLFGAEPLALSRGADLSGFLLPGEAPPDLDGRPVYLHHGGGLQHGPHESDKEAILRNGKKLVWWTQKDDWEFYDLAADPGETNNLAEEASTTMSDMKASLQTEFERNRELGESLSLPGFDRASVRLSREEMENLTDLGYIKK